MELSNFGEQFSSKVLKRVWNAAVYKALVNRDYEGEVRKAGDRLNILSFLNQGELNDYVVGQDMPVQRLVDAEDQLVIEKRKSYNISLDQLEDLFTYADDIPESLLDAQSQVLERTIDTYVLDKAASEVKAGSWIGTDLVVVGGANTMASLVTSATGGTVTLSFETTIITDQTTGATVENPRDGGLYFGGFVASDLYKGFRLRSSAAFVSPWYRISGITSSVVATLTEWDEATAGPDFEENYTLRGTFGGDGINFPKYGSGDASLIGMTGLGWEIQAAIATQVTAAVIYDQITLLAEKLDDNEIPAEGRKITLPPAGVTSLRQASELQPSGIAEIYSGTVINGKVMRIGAFDVHSAAGSRLSTRAGHNPSTGSGADAVLSAAAIGYQIPGHTLGFITYGEKWSESRVVNAEDQFAKKYQGLFLFGAKVPRQRRKFAAGIFGTF